ncbi:unnamed protein product [Rotaria magnacalcarata]|uniref:Uncharacterized protein n=2 Tax=Rotaria magnacalcarata TaxID=392030 RepID=A0A816ABD6_9BILA|nr:unnamed protein product [Rotaria magnacalcarata]CAF3821742.1 unnamed protein product [Rotaria magnacalcarata]
MGDSADDYVDDADEDLFSINPTTGDLWILKPFERGIKSNYSLFICSLILINILDENDNICLFNSSKIK